MSAKQPSSLPVLRWVTGGSGPLKRRSDRLGRGVAAEWTDPSGISHRGLVVADDGGRAGDTVGIWLGPNGDPCRGPRPGRTSSCERPGWA